MSFPGKKVELFYDSVWNELGNDVLGLGAEDGEVVISKGTADESGGITPTVVRLALKNPTGKYSYRNALSTLYGKIGPNTPLRVSADVADITTVIDRFSVDSASGWPNAESGHDYTHAGAAATQFVVSAGDAIHRHAATATTYTTFITSVSATDFDAYIRNVRLEAVLTGAGSAELRFRVRIESGNWAELYLLWTVGASTNVGYRIKQGFVTTAFDNQAIVGAAHTTPVDVRIHVRKNTVRVKGWISTDTEPSTWQYTTTTPSLLPGTVELETNVSAGVTNAMPFDVLMSELRIEQGIVLAVVEVAEWPKRWDITSTAVWTTITAAGPTRRLRQGNTPLRSALFRYLSTLDGVTDYWDFENLQNPTIVPSAFADGRALIVSTSSTETKVDWSNDTRLAGSGALPVNSLVTSGLAPSQSFGSAVLRSVPTTHNEWSAIVFTYVPVRGDVINQTSGFRYIVDIANSPQISKVVIDAFEEDQGTDRIRVVVTAQDSAAVTVATVTATMSWTDTTHMIRVKVSRTGGLALQLRVYVNEALVDTGVSAGVVTVGQPYKITNIRTLVQHTAFPLTFGHFAIASGVDSDALETNAANILSAAGGWNGELATDRFERLCGELGLQFEVVQGTVIDDTQCGPQKELNPVNLLLESVNANDGIMYELSYVIGYGFRTRQSLEEADIITLDYAAHDLVPMIEATDDDALIRNKVTVTRLHGGESFTVTETTGPLGTMDPTASPPGAGLYDTQVTPDPNLFDVNDLPDYAGFRLYRGTWDETRWPALKAYLNRSQYTSNVSKMLSVVFSEIGEILSLVNVPAHVQPDDVLNQIRAAKIRLSNFAWDMTWTTIPSGPWITLGTFDDSDYGRLDTDGSELVVGIDDNDTELLVLTDNPLSPFWTEDPNEITENGFHLRLNPPSRAGGLGGEKVLIGGSHTVEDTFNRSALNGWGTSDSGHVTSTSGGAAGDYSVTGGTGRHSQGSVNVRRAVFYDVNILDFDLSGQVTCPVTPTGATIEQGVQARFVDNNNYLDFRLFLQLSGAVTVIVRQLLGGVSTTSPTTTIPNVAATDTIGFRFQAIGSRVYFRAWDMNDSEPLTWLIGFTATHVQTGDISCFSGLNTGNTNPLPVIIQWDNIILQAPRILPAYYDWFNRTVVNGMGSANSGGVWTTTFTGAGGSVNDYDVAPASVTTVMPDANAYHAAFLDDVDLLDACVSLTWTCPLATGASLHPGGILLRGTASNTYIYCRVTVTTAAAVTLEIIDVNAGVETTLSSVTIGWLTHVAATPLRVKAACDGSTVGMRIWNPAYPNNEPTFWHLTATDPTPATGFVGFRNTRATGNTNVNPTPAISDYRVENPQRITVSRSINGVVRAWDTATDVRLWHPLILGR